LEKIEGKSFDFPEKLKSDLKKHFCYVGRKPKKKEVID